MRRKVFACWKWQGDRRRFVRPDDLGGFGREIVREVTACPDCARRAQEAGEEAERDAAAARHASPLLWPGDIAARPPPYMSCA